EENGQLAALPLGDGRVLAARWPTLDARPGLAQGGAASGAEACSRAGLLPAARAGTRELHPAALAEAGGGLVLVLAGRALHGATAPGEPRGARSGRARAPFPAARPRRGRRR